MSNDNTMVPVHLPGELVLRVAAAAGSLGDVGRWVAEAAEARLQGSSSLKPSNNHGSPTRTMPGGDNRSVALGAAGPKGPGASTAVTVPAAVPSLLDEDEVQEVEDAVLSGFHNRDHPSIWALALLAHRTATGTVLLDDFLEEATDLADQLNGAHGGRLRLFPRPQPQPPGRMSDKKEAAAVRKWQGSRSRFKTFALCNPSGTKGPLVQWRVAGVSRAKGHLQFGLTRAGWSLLQDLDGIDTDAPHSPDHAAVFLRHLEAHAPGDFLGFKVIVRAIGVDGGERTAVTDSFYELWNKQTMQAPTEAWKENEKDTNTAGYVARGREWGLIQEKQRNRRYLLTDLGRQFAENGEI